MISRLCWTYLGSLARNLRSLADPAIDGDIAADRLDQVLDDREAQAGPAHFAAPGLIDPVKPLEDAREVVARDADPGVGHLDLDRLRWTTWQATPDPASLMECT